MTKTYELSQTIDGVQTVLGTLAFDAENNGILSLLGESAAHQALQQHWDAINMQPSLEIVRSTRKKNENGSVTRETSLQEITKDSPDYPPAVVHFLGLNHGYLFTQSN